MNFTFLCLLVMIFFSSSSADTASLVPAVCNKISQDDYINVGYKFCVLVLESHPQSSKATARQLAEISFQISLSKAKAISSTIDERLKAQAVDPLARTALKDCLDLYSHVPDELGAGLIAVRGWDLHTASIKASATMNATTTCRDGIKNRGDLSDLIEENNNLYQMGAISLGFTKLLRIIN